MVIRDILFDLAPEFQTADATALARIDRTIGYAAEEVNRPAWGTKADRGTALLAAHMLTVANRGGSGAAGPVIAESAGGRSIQYARTQPMTGQPNPYGTTGYGQEFTRLRDSLDLGPILL